jgi:hypothetical protein
VLPRHQPHLPRPRRPRSPISTSRAPLPRPSPRRLGARTARAPRARPASGRGSAMRAEGLERGIGALEGDVKVQTEGRRKRKWGGRLVERETDEVGSGGIVLGMGWSMGDLHEERPRRSHSEVATRSGEVGDRVPAGPTETGSGAAAVQPDNCQAHNHSSIYVSTALGSFVTCCYLLCPVASASPRVLPSLGDRQK